MGTNAQNILYPKILPTKSCARRRCLTAAGWLSPACCRPAKHWNLVMGPKMKLLYLTRVTIILSRFKQNLCKKALYYVYTKNTISIWLRGNCTPNQKLARFVLYLKIVNTFFKNSKHLIANCPRKKNGIEILVRYSVEKDLWATLPTWAAKSVSWHINFLKMQHLVYVRVVFSRKKK